MLPEDIRALYQRLSAVEAHQLRSEAIMSERETSRLERIAERQRLDNEVLRRLSALDISIQELTKKTRSHLAVASCVKGGTQALQWGSMGGGVVAVVVLIGKLLNFW